MSLKVVFNNIIKVVQKMFLHNKIGLLYPKSVAFNILTLPFFLLILTLHNKHVKSYAFTYFGIDIKNNQSLSNKDYQIELLAVYFAYLILTQTFYSVFMSKKLKVSKGKLTNIKPKDIPLLLFNIMSIIVIPRSVYLFIKDNMYFDDTSNLIISSKIGYYSALITVIGATNVWNIPYLLISAFITAGTIKFNDLNLNLYYPVISFKRKLQINFEEINMRIMLSHIFGIPFPRSDSSKFNKIALVLFVGVFFFVFSYFRYIPALDFLIEEKSLYKVVQQTMLFILLPIYISRNYSNKRYTSELIFLSNMVSFIIPEIL